MKTITVKTTNNELRVDNLAEMPVWIDPYYAVTRDENGNGEPLPIAIENGCGASIRFFQRWLSQRTRSENISYKKWQLKYAAITGEKNKRFVNMIR